MASKDFSCTRCGNCCTGIKIQFVEKDLDLWVSKDRSDILENVLLGVQKKGSIFFITAAEYYEREPAGGDIILGAAGWYDSESDSRLAQCPFLKLGEGVKNNCKIYSIRPQACRNFPLKQVDKGVSDRKIKQCPAL
ncbi:MAG: YkgJ family cysteine cluster protein [Methanobacteriota archaeon]